jgi:hypothetical protein
MMAGVRSPGVSIEGLERRSCTTVVYLVWAGMLYLCGNKLLDDEDETEKGMEMIFGTTERSMKGMSGVLVCDTLSIACMFLPLHLV